MKMTENNVKEIMLEYVNWRNNKGCHITVTKWSNDEGFNISINDGESDFSFNIYYEGAQALIAALNASMMTQ